MTKYFVTGATGFVGTVVVEELLKNGYEVVGLARSDQSAEKLKKAGVEPFRGDLEDLESLKRGARESDGVIHLGFVLDFNDFDRAATIDAKAVDTFIEELEGSNKPFIYTSGLFSVTKPIGEISTEEDRPQVVPGGFGEKRFKTEHSILDVAAKKGIRATVIRLPVVHGTGDVAFIPQLINIAKQNGVSYYIDEGNNYWPAISKKDTAVLYRLVVEKGVAGTAYHATDEEGIETKKIAETIGKKLNISVESISSDKAHEKLGFFGTVFAFNAYGSSEKTRKQLGWEPKGKGLLEDILENY